MSSFALRSLLCGPALAALTLASLSVHAATLTWDGDTGANFGGLWESGVNWSTNAVPGAADIAQLLDVTTGTRTVTISSGSPQTISRLVLTQTTAGAFNVLNVDDNLTISGNATPFAITATAGQSSIITNIAANKTLLATHTGSMTVAFGGTLNLAAGSIFKLRASGAASDMTVALGGPLNATGAGAQVVVQPDRFVTGTGGANFSGAVTVNGAGSSLDIRRLSSTDTVTSMTTTFSGNDGAGNSVNVGDNAQLSISTTVSTANFTNRVTVGVDGIMNVGVVSASSGTSAANFNGGLVMGAGSNLNVYGNSASVALAGTSSMGTGAEMLLQFNHVQGNVSLTNSGAFTMDGAAIRFDYAATGSNNGVRGFTNTGTWTLKNNSSLALVSSTGTASTGGGFGNFRNVANSGTLSVESGSSMGFESMVSTGTLNLGSSTTGVSDATVVMGSPANTFTTVLVNNGYTTGNSTLNVLGNVFIGRAVPSSSGIVYLDNGTVRNGGTPTTGTDSTTGSTINVGDGSTAVLLTLGNFGAEMTNATGNTVNLKSNATVLLKSTQAGAAAAGSAIFTNNGTLNHTGALGFQGNFNGARTFAHGANSVYRISGQNAAINSLAGNGSGTNVAAITFTSSGRITGNSAFDKLTYTNSTGNTLFDTLALAQSGGEITAGNGTNGSGASSIGTLAFANTNITLSGATKLSFDIGGLGNDEAPLDGNSDPILTFDRLVLDASRTFALGTGAVLDIWMTNGFGTTSAQTYTLIDTGLGGEGTVTGSFATLLFQGQAVTNEYTVNIGNGMMTITLAAGLGAAAIPEPSTYALLVAVGAVAIAMIRGRRRSR